MELGWAGESRGAPTPAVMVEADWTGRFCTAATQRTEVQGVLHSQEDAGRERSPGGFQDSDAEAEACDTPAWSLVQLQAPAAASPTIVT